MKTPLISIITPAYNNAHLLHRLFDSILSQTYHNIEMFLIDDGSADNTKEVTENYISKFAERGYTLKYVYQENSGQSVAINNGLKLIKGEYLLWPDSDDFYATTNAIESLYKALLNADANTEIARCVINYIDESTLTVIGTCKKTTKESLFYDCLLNTNNFYFVAGGYMIKTKNLEKYIPNREIYTEKRAGQNWQLFLPYFYAKKCITLTEPMYNVVCRSDSHSRAARPTYKQRTEMLDVYQRTIIETINRTPIIPQKEKDLYNKMVIEKYLNEKLKDAIITKEQNVITELYNFAESHDMEIVFKTKLQIQYPTIYKVLSMIKKAFSYR